MCIYKGYNAALFKKLDRDTFKFLKSDKDVLRYFNMLAVKAGHHYDIIKNDDLLGRNDINFSSCFNILWMKKILCIHIGSKTQASIATYFIAICEVNNNVCDIKRKYHFDFNKNENNDGHPHFHFQYAGEKPESLLNHRDEDYDFVLNPWLSEPRLFFPPVSLALLLNLIFKEFNNEVTSKIREGDKWRALVKRNEEDILMPFIKRCNEFLCSTGRHNARHLFLTDYCYGK